MDDRRVVRVAVPRRARMSDMWPMRVSVKGPVSGRRCDKGRLHPGTDAIRRCNSATCAWYSSWYRSHSPR